MPHGAKWQRTTPKSAGCLGTLAAPSCPGPAASTKDAEVGEVLGAQQAAIVDCVVTTAGADAEADGWKQSVAVTVVIKKGGELFSVDTALEPAGEKAEALKACVEKMVRTLAWPATDATMLSFEKSWSFSSH